MNFNLYKLAAMFIIVAIIIASFWKIRDLKRENQRQDTLLSKTNTEYKDEKQRNVTVTQQLEIKQSEIRSMERRARRDSSRLTQLEKDVLQAKGVIEDMGKKLRDVTSVTGGTISTHTDNTTPYQIIKYKNVYLPIIDTIRTRFLMIAFKADTLGKLNVRHEYTNRFHVVLDRSKLKRNGDVIKHPRLPWYWFKDWEYFASATSDDTSAHVTNLLNVNF